MKDFQLLYDYVRRWWLLMLVGATLGAVMGQGYYTTQVHPKAEYFVTANMVVDDPEYTGTGSPPKVTIALAPAVVRSAEQVIKHLRQAAANLTRATGSTVVVQDLFIETRRTDEPRWKALVFGSTIGTLLVIGGIFVWEDARADQ